MLVLGNGKEGTMGNILETNTLTKVFKEQTAVDACSLHVPAGAVYGLLGPNGAGKSTLLKMVCGMLRPMSGDIVFAGRPWTRADLNSIGALIEMPPLYDNLTARENLRVRTTLLGVPKSSIDEVLATVGLAGTGSKRAGQFSLGMKQRLGIALALVGNPRLLILDEPTNSLDPVGIIVGGRLAYEVPLDKSVELERLFMDVCLGKAVA